MADNTSLTVDNLRRLLEALPDALVISDPEGRIVLVNAQTEKLFGYRRERTSRPARRDAGPRAISRAARRAADRYFADPQVRPMGANLELWGRRRDGDELPVEISLSPLRTATGLLVDVDGPRHQRPAAGRDPVATRRTAIPHARRRNPGGDVHGGLDEGTVAISELYVSPQIEKLLGFTQKEWLEEPGFVVPQLHPDDRDRWHGEFARTWSTGAPFNSMYRFISRDGRVVWVHGQAKVVRDRDGRPLFLQGVAFDITRLKQAEEPS